MLYIILMHFLTLCLFSRHYLLLYLDYGNDVRQKANLSNFLEFKMGCKAAETTRYNDLKFIV